MMLKGEIWIISGRKGRLTVKLLDDVVPEAHIFFDAELIAGTPLYASHQHEISEVGDTLTFRTSLTEFIEKVEA